MNCESLFDDSPGGPDRDAVLRHLEGCADCRALMDALAAAPSEDPGLAGAILARTTGAACDKPLPLSASCFAGGRLLVRLSGAAAAVESAIAKLGGVAVADGAAFWASVRDHAHPFFVSARDGAPVWRLSLKSTPPYADLGGEPLIEWGGALRWLVAPRTDAAKLRAWAQANGGHATLFAAKERAASAFHPLPGPLAGLHARLRAEFDPHGILNPGRMGAVA